MKSTRVIAIVAIILIIAGGLYFFQKKEKTSGPDTETIKSGTQLKQESDQPTATTETKEQKGNMLTGTLQKSDNAKNGSLKLVMDKQTLYIFTSRDYSSLIGKQVDVSYEGTLDTFVLGDIVEHK